MSRLFRDPKLAPVAAAAASVVLFAAPWLVPIIGTFASVWAPAPLMVLYRRQGSRAGRLAVMLALAGAVVIVGSLVSMTGALFYVFYAAAALVLGEAHAWGQSDESGIAAAAGVSCGAILLVVWGTGFMNVGAGEWDAFWAAQTQMVVQAYQESGLPPERLEDIRQTLLFAGRLIARLALGIVACGALIMAWANQLLVRRVGNGAEPREALNTWKAPDYLVWVLIGAGALMLLFQGFWFWAGANVVMVLSLVYFFQGMAVLAFWLQKKNTPRLLRAGIYVLVAVEIFLAAFVALMGLFDLWFNFRRLGKEPAA
jgi:uncharacterized protein YybS (DUF2232 family)